MKRFLLRTTGLVVALSIAAAGCAAKDPVVISGDYPHYGSPEELWEVSTLVIEADLGDDRRFELYRPQSAPELPLPMAIYTATITKSWKGGLAEGEVILVREWASAAIDGTEYKVDDAGEPMEPGGTYLLFLETNPDAPHGIPALLVNPVQGAYPLRGGEPTAQAENDVPVAVADLETFDPAAGDQDPRFAEGYRPGQDWESARD